MKKNIKRKKQFFWVIPFMLPLLLLLWYIGSAPTVSVVLSTYNRENFLPKAIESILKQTMTDFEFIIIDDGSKDRTAQILQAYAEKDSRIRVVTHAENKGLIASLNEGINMARGTYIARMDDDDESFMWRFEKQVEFLENHPDIVGVGSWVSPPGEIKPYTFQRETNPERIKILLLLGENSVSHPALMIRRDFLTKNHIYYRDKYKAAEDRPFYADIMFAGGRLSNVPETLLHYRLHANNSQDYYVTQHYNIFRFHRDYLKAYFNLSLDRRMETCDVLALLIQANKEVGLLDANELNKINAERCGGEYLIFVHPHWTARVSIDSNGELKRKDTLDRAQVLHNDSDTITIKWENWGTETFKKIDESHYQFLK